MLNKEKYVEELLNFAYKKGGFAIVKEYKEPIDCMKVSCKDCIFEVYGNCEEARKEWANNEYVEPPVDWSKVPVDTPVLVRDAEHCEWKRRYFARYNYNLNRICTWSDGATSWSAHNEDDISAWSFGKLAKNED